MDTYGADNFRRMYGHGEFQAVYGKSLEALELEWRGFLAGYSLDESMLEVARFRFDRPSIFGKRCARSIAARFVEANGFLTRRDVARARQCYARILNWDPENVSYRVQIAERYLEAGLVEDAQALVNEVRDDERAGRVNRLRAAELIADAAWLEGDYSRAASAYAEQRPMAVLPADIRRLHLKHLGAERCLRSADDCMVWQRALAARPSTPMVAQVAELLHPALRDDPAAMWLVALRLYETDSEEFARWMERFLSTTDPTFTGPEYRLHGLRLLATHAWRQGRFGAACERWRELLSEAPAGTGYALDASLWVGRCHRPERPTLDLQAGAME
jgi:tetratricopeptide (TPR) repeat protein